jgi:hypothetical protein
MINLAERAVCWSIVRGLFFMATILEYPKVTKHHDDINLKNPATNVSVLQTMTLLLYPVCPDPHIRLVIRICNHPRGTYRDSVTMSTMASAAR